MKIIELLNKIANGEEVNMIELEGKRYKYIDNEFVDAGGCCFCGWLSSLNDEVEIIGENKKIEALKLNNSDLWTGKTNEDLIVDKINEIIKKLNKEE